MSCFITCELSFVLLLFCMSNTCQAIKIVILKKKKALNHRNDITNLIHYVL